MRQLIGATLILGVALSLTAQAADGADGHKHFSAQLVPYQEVPALSSQAVGDISVSIDDDAQTIAYQISFNGIETVTQAHIHIAQPGVNGGVMLWLCGTASNPGPAGTPVCPANGTVSRLLGPADVVGPAGQGISAGEFAEVAAAIRAGVAYANVHSTRFSGGEIRGQLQLGQANK